MIDYQYIAGGLTKTPELRFTPNGNAVTNFTLAQSDSRKNDAGEWEDTNHRYIPVHIWDSDRTAWSDLLVTLNPGTKLVVFGKLVTRDWETEQGEKRSITEFQARHIYVDLAAGHTGGSGSPRNTNTNQPPQDNSVPAANDWIVSNSTRGGFGQNAEAPF